MLHKGLGASQARTRCLELLELVPPWIGDAETRLKSWPHQLSGGQRQRIMIAMALANEPELLIADEPTTALDVTVQAQVLELLRDLQRKLGMAILLITHDLTIVRNVADRVYVMNDGEIVENGATEALYRDPKHPCTRKLLAAEPTARPPPADHGAAEVMGADDLRVWFPIQRGVLRRTVGHVKAVDGVTVRMREGQTVGVVGESGSGKTTLGMALLRLIASDGPNPVRGPRHRRSREPGPSRVATQDAGGVPGPVQLAVPAAVGVPDRRGGHARARRRHDIRRAPHPGCRRGYTRSASTQGPWTATRTSSRAASASGSRSPRALVLKPRFLVLDEPTSALDMTVQAQIVDLLRSLQERHRLAYLFISHDLRVVRALANEVIVLRAAGSWSRGPRRASSRARGPTTRGR